MTEIDLMLRFFIQVVVILATCKVLGWVGQRYFGQTQVVMEMIAGLFLGPSLLGLLAPRAQSWLFPVNTTYLIDGAEKTARHPSMLILYTVSQLGLVLFMFLVGIEFNVKIIQQRAKGAVSVSIAGILAPFILGLILAIFTYRGWGLFRDGISLGTACLYFGASMCVTAFPTLARIIHERGIAGTSLGTLALGSGAADDTVAWSLLALVMAFAKGSWTYASYAIGGGLLFGFVVLKFGKIWFAKLSDVVEREGKMPDGIFVTTMILLFAGAYLTDAIGIYAVFGAFIVGVAMPRGLFADEIRRRLESLTVGVLVPCFFIYSGLNTKVNLIDSSAMAMIAVVVIVAAIVGKGVACALAAKAVGEGWRESWAIGTLMNTRGLMELIMLNIGLQQGIITTRLYTIMVLMAIITTVMASPIFQWLYKKHLVHLHPGSALADGGV